jgi:hypothetical protein
MFFFSNLNKQNKFSEMITVVFRSCLILFSAAKITIFEVLCFSSGSQYSSKFILCSSILSLNTVLIHIAILTDTLNKLQIHFIDQQIEKN